MDFLAFLKDYPAVATLISSIIYALFTIIIIGQNYTSEYARNKPKITIYSEIDEYNAIYLVIKNLGMTPAYFITFNTLKNNIPGTIMSNLLNLNIFRTGIDILPPYESIKFKISTKNELKNLKSSEIDFDISYKNFKNKITNDSIHLNLKKLEDLPKTPERIKLEAEFDLKNQEQMIKLMRK
ncbi:hypothetical protein [Methanococcus maripaludis]|uniref:Uncharacterized protein n=1 Tax=Methanococcus maripaludis OS7 TaxID=637915 RepID=A0A2Z5PW05_METMI|nr:hypothetical protein [Methanococcus maripaludis]BAP63341.1 hypothetical protein MMOS7_12550 [Methanococcus maripaludis OS7]